MTNYTNQLILGEGSTSSPSTERKKINLAPRSTTTPTSTTGSSPSTGSATGSATSSEAYSASSKSNPFGSAKPRDENAILKKKEEERKQREDAKLKE